MIEEVWVWGLCHGCQVHVMLTGRAFLPLMPPPTHPTPHAWQRSVQSVGKGGPGTRQIRSHNKLPGPLQGVPRMLSEVNRLPLARREGPPGPGHTRTHWLTVVGALEKRNEYVISHFPSALPPFPPFTVWVISVSKSKHFSFTVSLWMVLLTVTLFCFVAIHGPLAQLPLIQIFLNRFPFSYVVALSFLRLFRTFCKARHDHACGKCRLVLLLTYYILGIWVSESQSQSQSQRLFTVIDAACCRLEEVLSEFLTIYFSTKNIVTLNIWNPKSILKIN